MQFVAIRWRRPGALDIVITYQNESPEQIMNIAKNMEVIFVAAIALIGATSFATAASAGAAAPAATVASGKMQVVTIVGKRLHAAEKARIAQ